MGITSFNVPLLLFAAKVAPALAMGNTIIVKPSERNCFSTMYLGKLFKEAGFPPGVLNIVIGAGNTGALLARHPDVNKVLSVTFFVRSSDVCRSPSPALSQQASKSTSPPPAPLNE